jgi:nucleotide-binding universal stress UspA family protein
MKSYLVPTDFTSASENSLELAINLVKKNGGEIHLLNFCELESELEDSKSKLEAIDTPNNIPIFRHPRLGNYTEIGNVASELGAELIFMGTHGAKGLQKIKGSNALKTVKASATPYIIVQDGSITSNFENVIVPISFNMENLQKLKAVKDLALAFNSTVHLMYSWPKEDHQRTLIADNLRYAKEYLEDQDISFSLSKSAGNFNKDTIRLAQLKNAGLIAIMYLKKSSFGSIGKNYEQELLENKLKVPVLIMNPVKY